MCTYGKGTNVIPTGALIKCRACGEVVGYMGVDAIFFPPMKVPADYTTNRPLSACPLCGANYRKGDGTTWKWWEEVEKEARDG